MSNITGSKLNWIDCPHDFTKFVTTRLHLRSLGSIQFDLIWLCSILFRLALMHWSQSNLIRFTWISLASSWIRPIPFDLIERIETTTWNARRICAVCQYFPLHILTDRSAYKPDSADVEGYGRLRHRQTGFATKFRNLCQNQTDIHNAIHDLGILECNMIRNWLYWFKSDQGTTGMEHREIQWDRTPRVFSNVSNRIQ
jgi:hypothetical protein